LFAELTAVLERERIVRRYRLWPERKTLLLDGLISHARWVTPLPETQLPVHCRDSKDDRFLACALADACDYLVTGDQDLLVLNGDPLLGKLTILTPRQFIEAVPSHS
jgi:putative PIN family toxin of toxin-antitoxin system